jgi:hypothetical protein
MQTLVAGCRENVELTEKGHFLGSYATLVLMSLRSGRHMPGAVAFISGKHRALAVCDVCNT